MSRLVALLLTLAALSAVGREKPAATLAEWAKAAPCRTAYGHYVKGKKIGWSVDEVKLGKRDGADVVLVISEGFQETVADGERSVKKDKTTTAYELKGDGVLVYAHVHKDDNGSVVEREVVRKGGKLAITTKQGGRTSTRTVPLPRDTIAGQRKFEEWAAGERKAGDKLIKYSVSWDEEEIDHKETYVFKGRKKVLLGGVETTLLDVEVVLADGDKARADVFPDGRWYQGDFGGLLTLKMEPEKVAKKLDAKPVDLTLALSVPLEKDLGPDSAALDELKLGLTGIGDFKVPASPRQVVTPGKGTAAVELRRDFRREKAEPLSKAEEKRWTAATPRVQCDEKAVREQAEKIVGGEKDALKRAEKLSEWVFKTVKKTHAFRADSALEVLDRKAGVCTEHALLFVALARSLGIPAREVGGLAYAHAGKPQMVWHAWAEVHDGHQWVSVDPTWGQFYVDAGHLKLSEGGRDHAWANIAAKVGIKVIGFKKREK